MIYFHIIILYFISVPELKEEIADVKNDIAAVKHHIAELENSVAKLKNPGMEKIVVTNFNKT